MPKNTRDLLQVIRIDGRDAFVEVVASALTIDKVVVGFTSYNKNAEAGSRSTGNVQIYMDVFEALRLSRDIMSGRLAALAEAEKKKTAADPNRKYCNPIYRQQGGSTKDGIIAREFTITPGEKAPWILVGKKGPGHQTPQGLIVMDQATETVRVAMTSEKFKEFALALETCHLIWTQSRFIPIIAPSMKATMDERAAAIARRKDAAVQQQQ